MPLITKRGGGPFITWALALVNVVETFVMKSFAGSRGRWALNGAKGIW